MIAIVGNKYDLKRAQVDHSKARKVRLFPTYICYSKSASQLLHIATILMTCDWDFVQQIVEFSALDDIKQLFQFI